MSETRAPLSPRQYEALRRLADGSTREAVAADMGVTRSTLGTHMEEVFEALHVTSLVAAYHALGWLMVPA